MILEEKAEYRTKACLRKIIFPFRRVIPEDPDKKYKHQIPQKKTRKEKCQEWWVSTDYYSKPVQLNFKGQTEFTSFRGVAVSSFARTAILIFIVTRLLSMIWYTSETIYSTQAPLGFNETVQFGQLFGSSSFIFGFKTDEEGTNNFDEKQGQVLFYLQKFKEGKMINQTQIEMDFCGIETEGSEAVESAFGVPFAKVTMFCPQDLSQVTLMGNHYEDAYYRVLANVTRCLPSQFTDCNPDNLFYQFADTAVGALFLPRNTLELKDHSEQPVHTVWEKAYEFKIDLVRLERLIFTFQKNTAHFFDKVFANVLMTSAEFSFVKFLKYESFKREAHLYWPEISAINTETQKAYKMRGAGMEIMTFTFELDPVQVHWHRKQTTAWDFLAAIGGFALTVHFLGQKCYKTLSQGSTNRLQEKYFRD